MQNEQTNTTLNLTTVKDDMPFRVIWRSVWNEAIDSINVIFLVVIAFSVFMLMFVGLIVQASTDSGGAMFVLFVLGFVFIFTISFIWRLTKKTRIQLRAQALAQANGFSFSKGLKNPLYPGLIFAVGDTKRAYPIVEGVYSQRHFTVMNYSYMQGSGKNRSEYHKGVVLVKLPRKLPNVVFDSKANNFLGMSNLGTAFSGSQKFTLEGDFNKHFTVYAPQSYGLDVLYFMTPELMALLVDEASKYDIEVVDDNLFFYAPEFNFTTEQLEGIFRIIQNIGGEFAENTQRYADERVGDKNIDMVAEQGRRLKKSLSWVTAAAIIIYMVFQILPLIFNNG